MPETDLELWKIRSPLSGDLTDSEHDWYTAWGDWSNTNTSSQNVSPPLRIKWIRRYDGTVKHFSTCGGGRMYTHTAEGTVFAVEQETGRLLWKRYYPGVYISYTSPLYYEGHLLVPQAGPKQCRLRCFDAATGKLQWEAPFTGSPSWHRALPPIIYENLAIYVFGTGKYTTREGADLKRWLYAEQFLPDFPDDHEGLVRAYDLETGATVWEKNFSEFGNGGDEAGLCLMDDTLYYSCFFGHHSKRHGIPGPDGVTAALEPATGKVLWTTTKYSTRGGTTISGENGRLYVGGYAGIGGDVKRCGVWYLDAKDGSLIWESDPLEGSIHVVSVGKEILFTHVQYGLGYVLDKRSGRVLSRLRDVYPCTRFTLSEPCLLGPNLDLIDLTRGNELVSTGPAIETIKCVGSVASNGRIFYTANGTGIQCCCAYGAEVK